MNHFFSFDYLGGPFELFSMQHLFAVLIITAMIILLYRVRRALRAEGSNQFLRILLIALLILSEASLTFWFLLVGKWSAAYSLPLHLCSLSLFLAAAMLVNKSCVMFGFVYFAGLSGAIQAILTPDLGPYAFPHFRAFQFFIAHGAVVLACFFMIFVEGFRPQLKSIWHTLGLLNVYALFVGIINRITGGNYLFLTQKPENASLMDFLGPWPWYIFSLEIVALMMFVVLYLPFLLFDKKINKRKSGSQNHHQLSR